jgi:hypothetical protein
MERLTSSTAATPLKRRATLSSWTWGMGVSPVGLGADRRLRKRPPSGRFALFPK